MWVLQHILCMKGIHLTEHMTAVAIVNTATPFTGLEVWIKIKVWCPIVSQ